MKVTSVKLIHSEQGRMKAFASITIDNALAIHGIRVIQGDDKLFVAMPSKKDGDGKFRDIVHPIKSELRKLVEEAVLEHYNEAEVTR
jgi:stage V sporulation protein G